jgi:signal transduction histidine kinase
MNRLWVRLTGGFLLIVLLLLLLVTLAINAAVTNSFRRYVTAMDVATFGEPTLADLVNYYRTHSAWKGAEPLLPAGGMGGNMGGNMGGGMGSGGRGPMGVHSYVAGGDGIIAAATNRAWVGRAAEEIGAARTAPLYLDGALIGTVGQQSPGGQRIAEAGHQFAEQINAALRAISLLAALLALAAGILLSYTLARPLERLAARIHPLTSAQLGRQIPVTVPVEGPTEVRALAQEFNDLAERLHAGERQRQQMSSDIAHELRTPVTVLRGHLEAMMDGIYPLDLDHLATGYDQVLHLARLVEDLRLLTQAETGRLELHLEPLAVSSLVAAAAARFAPLAEDAGVTVIETVTPDLPPVCVDSGRMQQVFDNLLANALRHTPAGGEIAVIASQVDEFVEITITNPGILASNELDHLFDRFWRADVARQRDVGGSGLGLAITHQLVLLQGGAIRAEVQDGTVHFVLTLPAAVA